MMTKRLAGWVLAAAFSAALTLGAHAQQPRAAAPSATPADKPAAAKVAPGRDIELLLEALKIAPDEATAKHIEQRIFLVWSFSPSDTANLLMTRAKSAIDKKNYDLALKLLTVIVELRPDFAEAWNRRATVYYLQKDYGRALSDLREALGREPRHFAALAGLGSILSDLGDETRALDAFRRALALHPHLKGIAERVKELAGKVDGRDI